jgi:hypothetical protein
VPVRLRACSGNAQTDDDRLVRALYSTPLKRDLPIFGPISVVHIV